MKIIKRTKNYIYVELGDRDQEEVFTSSDLVRVERQLIDKYYSLRDAVKCDGYYEEVNYPTDWVVEDKKCIYTRYMFKLPNNVDELIEKNNLLF